ISASSGDGLSRRNAVTLTTKPGVQNPHCSPCASMNACWTVDSPPFGPLSPSTVVTSAPSACTANMRHDRTARPSNITVHAPHTPCSHARWVPVRPRPSRRKSARVVRAPPPPRRSVPFTVSATSCSDTTSLLDRRVERGLHQVRGHALAVRTGGVHVFDGLELGRAGERCVLHRVVHLSGRGGG